jgi:hypothetical protein
VQSTQSEDSIVATLKGLVMMDSSNSKEATEDAAAGEWLFVIMASSKSYRTWRVGIAEASPGMARAKFFYPTTKCHLRSHAVAGPRALGALVADALLFI